MAYKLILLSILVCLFTCACETNRTQLDESKLKEIERLLGAVPTHPDMAEIDNSSSTSGAQAGVTKRYKSSTPFTDVKGFYTEKLPPKGWKFVEDKELKHYGMFKGERLLEFQQGEYQLNIKYNGDRKVELGSDYLIWVGLRE